MYEEVYNRNVVNVEDENDSEQDSDVEDEETLIPIEDHSGNVMTFDYVDPRHYPLLLKAALNVPEEQCEQIWKDKPKTFFEQRDNNGRTALHIATMCGLVKPVELFIKYIDPNLTDFNGNIALSYCKNFEIGKMLIDHGSSVNHRNNDDELPLHRFAQRNVDPLLISYLLEHDADVDGKDYSEFTALHIACYLGYLEIVQVLLYYSACTTEGNDLSMTPIMIAAMQKHESIIEELWLYLDRDEATRVTDDEKSLLFCLLSRSFQKWGIRLINEFQPDVDMVYSSNSTAANMSMNFDSPEVFYCVWKNLRRKYTFNVINFIYKCEFTPTDFLNVLHMILEDGRSYAYYKGCTPAFVNISKFLSRFRSLCEEDAKIFLFYLLCYGMILKEEDFWEILLSDLPYKYSLLSIVVHFINVLPTLNDDRFPFQKYYILGRASPRNILHLMPFMHQEFSVYTDIDCFDTIAVNFSFALFFLKALRHNYREVIISPRFKLFFEKLRQRMNVEVMRRSRKALISVIRPKIPTLVELSRNSVRRALANSNCNDMQGCKKIFRFIYDSDLPERLKKVLFFEENLYTRNRVD